MNTDSERNAGTASVGRAAWMEGGWGVMHHYRDDGSGDLNGFQEQTDRFDVETLAGQLEDLGARWLIMCVCHNASSLYWCSPNQTLEDYAGEPVCSRRDLIADLAAALRPRNIHLIVYIWSWTEAQKNVRVQDALAPDYPQRWCDVIGEYSRRWGRQVSGWWFDGAHVNNEPSMARLAAAARSGNPDSAIAFNGGWGKLDRFVPDDDYCAGEHLCLPPCPGQYDNGALCHVLNPIGEYWGGCRGMEDGVYPEPKLNFTDERLIEFMKDWIVRNGAAVTLDVPFRSYRGVVGALGGVIPELYFRQLSAMSEKIRS